MACVTGALKKMLPPFKMALGGPMGNGKQWMSWIHLDDIVGMIRFAIDNESINGAINGTAPTPVINSTFSKTLGKVLKRPALQGRSNSYQDSFAVSVSKYLITPSTFTWKSLKMTLPSGAIITAHGVPPER